MKTITCETCKTDFIVKLKQAYTQRFCSVNCYNRYQKGRRNPCYAKLSKTCPQCSTEFATKKSEDHTFCSAKCFGAFSKACNPHRGANRHPRITVNGQRVYTHRHIMEVHLGRKLIRGEVVHHINGNPADNRIENLQVMTHKEHRSLHEAENKLVRQRLLLGGKT